MRRSTNNLISELLWGLFIFRGSNKLEFTIWGAYRILQFIGRFYLWIIYFAIFCFKSVRPFLGCFATFFDCFCFLIISKEVLKFAADFPKILPKQGWSSFFQIRKIKFNSIMFCAMYQHMNIFPEKLKNTKKVSDLIFLFKNKNWHSVSRIYGRLCEF